MIIDTSQEVRALEGTLSGYLGVLDLSPRTFGSWTQVRGEPVVVSPIPPKPVPLSAGAEIPPHLHARVRALAHRRHRSYGLPGLWKEFQGEIRRAPFRSMARHVRAQVNYERRLRLQRYEFLHPDVAHSFDYSEMPREAPWAPKRYFAKIQDDYARLSLKRALTNRKGSIFGGQFVQEHLESAPKPLVFKFDLEFDTPDFYAILLRHRVVPLPSPAARPQFNGKTERSYRDVKDWLREFESDVYWSEEELTTELGFCFQQIDEVDEREVLGGRTARAAYETSPRADVDSDIFFSDAVEMYDKVMQTSKAPPPSGAWRYAAKETLKKYGLVWYSRP